MNHGSGAPYNIQLSFGFTQKQHAGVRGNLSTIKINDYFFSKIFFESMV